MRDEGIPQVSEFPMYEEAREFIKRFGDRPRDAILSGDQRAFGNLPASAAFDALQSGSYKGLEGVDFGTSFGRPVAKLPNGAVIQVEPGQMLAAIRRREAKRRELVIGMANQINMQKFADENREAFTTLLDGIVEDGGLSEEARAIYINTYENNPGGVLSVLAGIDRQDKRSILEANNRALAEARNNSARVIGAGVETFGQELQSSLADDSSPENISRTSMLTGAAQVVAGMGKAEGEGFQANPINVEPFANSVVRPLVMSAGKGVRDAVTTLSEMSAQGELDPTSPAYQLLSSEITGFLQKLRVAPRPEFVDASIRSLLGQDVSMLGRTAARREGEAETGLVNRTFEQTRSRTGRGSLEQNFDMDASGDLSQEELASMAVSVVRDYFTARNDQRFADATDEQILQIVADPDIEFVDGALARIVKRIMGFGLDLSRIRQDALGEVFSDRQPGGRQRGGPLQSSNTNASLRSGRSGADGLGESRPAGTSAAVRGFLQD